jgi:metal transporter CNNM
MITTGLISYPLALLLDAIAGKKQDHEIFTNSEIAALVKYHEHSEKHGGDIGEDASRIMLGALQLDSRKIGGDIPPTLGRIAEEDIDAEKDLEKADPVLASGMVVRWSAVKTIDIDEAVDGNFIRKVKSWSYSRIPVIGGQAENSDLRTTWEGKHIYGFLHIKVLGTPTCLTYE